MGPLFTQFVRSLEEAPDERLALAAWDRLREILRSELKRRGLWQSPPSYLGIFGWSTWSGEPGAGDGALEELVAECYSFIFVDRLGRLQAQIRAKPNIEGLILLNVRHFFLERQKEHDPLGFRVFEMVQSAVRQAVEHGEIFVLAGDPQVRNNTVLGFSPDAEAEVAATSLSALLAHWNDELLPDMVMARGKRQEEVWSRLRRLLQELEGQGVRSFRFRDVLDPLKSDSRLRWAALLEEREEGGGKRADIPKTAALAPKVLPEVPVESQESLEKLTRYVSAAVSRMPMDPRTRDYLATLWQYLKLQTGAGEPVSSLEQRRLDLGDEDRFSHRQLSQILEIPRDRLPVLFSTLRRLVTEAQALARSGRRARQPAASRTHARHDEPAPWPPEPPEEQAGTRGRLHPGSGWEEVG